MLFVKRPSFSVSARSRSGTHIFAAFLRGSTSNRRSSGRERGSWRPGAGSESACGGSKTSRGRRKPDRVRSPSDHIFLAARVLRRDRDSPAAPSD